MMNRQFLHPNCWPSTTLYLQYFPDPTRSCLTRASPSFDFDLDFALAFGFATLAPSDFGVAARLRFGFATSVSGLESSRLEPVPFALLPLATLEFLAFLAFPFAFAPFLLFLPRFNTLRFPVLISFWSAGVTLGGASTYRVSYGCLYPSLQV